MSYINSNGLNHQLGVFEVAKEHPALMLGGVVEESFSNSQRSEWVDERFKALFTMLCSWFCEVKVVASWSGGTGSSYCLRCSLTVLC
eukprot:snap_masked-scaffold_28-processed-gene-4.84-mRNA-1 protein AED:1.00 eAED:1.00 QI:0/-1/0/0/-1/1/1/0/86